jgi:hypothetical protein
MRRPNGTLKLAVTPLPYGQSGRPAKTQMKMGKEQGSCSCCTFIYPNDHLSRPLATKPLAAPLLAEFNRTAQFFTLWIKASWISHASSALPLKRSKSIMTVAVPWSGREHASRRCGTFCRLLLMIRTVTHSWIPDLYVSSRSCTSY